MVSLDAEAGEAVSPPQPTPPAASPAAGAADGSGEPVVLKAHYGSTAVNSVVRRNSPLGGLAKAPPKLSVVSKPGEDSAAAAEGEGRRTARSSLGSGAGSRGPSVFDRVERFKQPRWKKRVARVMAGVPYTLLSMLITLLVRASAAAAGRARTALHALNGLCVLHASCWWMPPAGLLDIAAYLLAEPSHHRCSATRRCCTRTTSGWR